MKAGERESESRAADAPTRSTEPADAGTIAPGERYTDAGAKPAVSSGHALTPGPSASELAFGSAPRGAGMIALDRVLGEPLDHLELARKIQALIARYPTERAEILEAVERRDASLAHDVRALEQRASDAPQVGAGGPKAGDFTFRPTFVPATNDQYDNAQNKAKADEDRERERSAARHGDKPHVGEVFREPETLDQSQRQSLGKADQAIANIRGQIRDAGPADGGVESPLELHKKLER